MADIDVIDVSKSFDVFPKNWQFQYFSSEVDDF